MLVQYWTQQGLNPGWSLGILVINVINNKITNSFCCFPLAKISQSTGMKRFCSSKRIRVQIVATCKQTGSHKLTICSRRFLGSEMIKCPFFYQEKNIENILKERLPSGLKREGLVSAFCTFLRSMKSWNPRFMVDLLFSLSSCFSFACQVLEYKGKSMNIKLSKIPQNIQKIDKHKWALFQHNWDLY